MAVDDGSPEVLWKTSNASSSDGRNRKEALDGSPEMLWKTNSVSSSGNRNRKEALDAFYEQMAWQQDLTLKDLVLSETPLNPAPGALPPNPAPAAPIRSAPNLSPAPAPAPVPVPVSPPKMATVYEEVECEERQSPRKSSTVGELLGNREDYIVLSGRSRAPSRPQVVRTKLCGVFTPRTLSRTGNRNFDSKRCTKCGKKPLWLKTRCLVCGKLYCRKCVDKGMGDQVDGPKCVKCIGYRPNERYLEKKASTWKQSLKLVTQNLGSLKKTQQMAPKNSGGDHGGNIKTRKINLR